MPFQSSRQRRFIYAAAARGEAWARKFIRDSGGTPPPMRDKGRQLVEIAKRRR